MTLELALVIRGDQSGAKKALDETAQGIEQLGRKAETAKKPVADMAEGVEKTAEAAPEAATGVDKLGEAASNAGLSFGTFKTAAIGAIGGIAGALASAALSALFGAALGAAKSYFDELTNSADNIKDDLDAHKGLIRSIKGLWDEASGAASSYGLVSAQGLRFEAQQNIARLEADLGSSLGRLSGSETFNFYGAFGHSVAARAPFDEAIARFRQDVKDGRADVVAFREEVARIAEALPTGDEGRGFAETILGDTQEAALVQAELLRAVDLFRALSGDAEAAAAAMGSSAEGMAATGAAAANALPALREYEALIRALGGSAGGADPVGSGPGGFGALSAAGFASGGFTGHSPADRIAGVVHGREYVFDAESTARIGVENLEAMRRGVRGYAGGGLVAGGVSSFAGSFGNSLLNGVFSGLGHELQFVKGAVREFAGELMATRNPLAALAQTVSSVSQSYLNSALGNAGTAIGNLLLGGIGLGGGWNVPANFVPGGFYPGLAGGGTVTSSGLAWVGEQGPELRYLNAGDRIIPHREAMALGGAPPVINNFFVETPTPRAFAESRSSVARAGARLAVAAQRHV